MDRMPKEYKIAVYILFIGLIYYVFFSYAMFLRMRTTGSPMTPYTLIFSLPIFLVYFIPSVLFLLKKEISLKILTTVISLNIFVNILLSLGMVYFKEFTTIISNLGIKENGLLLLMGIARMFPQKVLLVLSLETPWLIYLLYLLNHKETKEFVRTKTYQLVNTQQFTLGIIIILFITLTIIGMLFGL